MLDSPRVEGLREGEISSGCIVVAQRGKEATSPFTFSPVDALVEWGS